jgi:hypothetical protein
MSKIEHISHYKNVEDFTPNYDIDKNGDPIKLSAIEPNEPTAFDEQYKKYFLPSERIIENDEFWSFIDTDRKTGIFKAGTFSVITGQQKTRKTFFLSILASSWIARNTKVVNLISNPPENKKVCLYFDTEQSESSAQRVQKRILKLAKLESSNNFHYFNMRGAEIVEQIDFIFKAIDIIENVGFVIIDGIADLLESINDEINTKKLHRLIEKTTIEKSIHLTYVLHFNKGSEHVSGWIGSTGVRKADCVIKLSKCKELPNKRSVVTCMDLRDSQNFDDFSFEISEDGLPFSVENYKQKARLPINLILEREQIASVVKLSHKNEISLTEFRNNLELELKRCAKENELNIEFTARRFSDFVEYLRIETIIILQTKGTSKKIKLNDKHLIFNNNNQLYII